MAAYYNEIDSFAAAWLRELIAAGLIADGEVDERDIREVEPRDLQGFVQHHFFAGIGGWSYALRIAGWPDDKPVWTGSCPCQPWSAAGKRKGKEDDRHLWPAWFNLIRESRPPVVFGEQVEGAIGHGWWDIVQRDLEGEDYAWGMAVLGAHSVGAPHRRQRLWFVAHTGQQYRAGWRDVRDMGAAQVGDEGAGGKRERIRNAADDSGSDGGVAHPQHAFGRPQLAQNGDTHGRDGFGGSGDSSNPAADSVLCGVGQSSSTGLLAGNAATSPTGHGSAAIAASFRSDTVWLPCRDGKLRPTQPGLQPLAHGVPARVGRLRSYGNAIVPQVAAEFIQAYRESIEL